MNSYITNKKELPENVWFLTTLMPVIGIIMIFTSTDPKWISVLITLIIIYACGEGCANTYTTFTFESGRFIVGLPYRKYSLLWIKANRTLTVEDTLWDEIQIAHIYNRSKTKVFRRTFYFMKDGKYAYYFSAIGCEDFENELRLRHPDKNIHIIKTEPKYRDIRPFLESRKERVI